MKLLNKEDLYARILKNEYINWGNISNNYFLTEDDIKRFSHRLDWESLCINQDLSEKTLMNNKKYLNQKCWELICYHQILSEQFITNNKSHLNNRCWRNIALRQRVSFSFIISNVENFDKDVFNVVCLNLNFIQKLICKIVAKFKG